MSKLFWGGLRVGWVRGPKPLIARLTRVKVAADLGGSVVSQALAARILPRRDEVAQARRREFLPRFDHLSALLGDGLPEWSWVRPEGGLTLWVRLPSRRPRSWPRWPCATASRSCRDRSTRPRGVPATTCACRS